MASLGFSKLFLDWIKKCISDIPFMLRLQAIFNPPMVLGRVALSLNLSSWVIFWLPIFCLLMTFLFSVKLLFPISWDLIIFYPVWKTIVVYLSTLIKSFICFTNGTENALALSGLINLHLEIFPFKYLGVLLHNKQLKATDFNPLTDKIFVWLVGWKTKLLSYGGRLQLIRYFICGYLAYWFRAIPFTKGVFKKLSTIARFFFHGKDQNKVHMIVWNKVACPTSRGGVGLISPQDLKIIF